MINKEAITRDNFGELRVSTAKLREDQAKQEETLVDTRLLRDFAKENGMDDQVVELFFEEALVHQHGFMEKKDKNYLLEMKNAVEAAKSFVEEKGLAKWESRLARFLGRVADYEEKYQEAANFYKEAIEKAPLDPNFQGNPALIYEYRGFLALDELRTGGVNEGIINAESLYGDYEVTDEGKELKSKDYTTWAIWRSGVAINLCKTLIDLGKLEEYRERIVNWLNLAEKDLQPPEGVQIWSDFGFRKSEIQRVREQIV